MKCRLSKGEPFLKNVVYIVGAGFSADLGIPTVGNFYQYARTLYVSNRQRYKHFDEVFRYVQDASVAMNYLDADLFNIEELLSIVEMDKVAGYRKKKYADIKKFISDVIVSATPQIAFDPIKTGGSHSEFFRQIGDRGAIYEALFAFILSLCRARLRGIGADSVSSTCTAGVFDQSPVNIPDCQYSVISFNYDTVIESCVRSINERMSSHDRVRIVQDFDEQATTQDVRVLQLSLSKLHGSLKDVDGFESDTIVPPTSMKYVPKELQSHWKCAHRRIANAHELRFVGYSMPEGDSYRRCPKAS